MPPLGHNPSTLSHLHEPPLLQSLIHGLRHERGTFYVAWLLKNRPEEPIHALDLMAKVPELYRKQLGLPRVTDPGSGKAVTLGSGARIQERSLALDDVEAMRALLRKKRELERILDSEDEMEPVKAEALRELEEIAEFERRRGRESRDSARRAAHAVRSAMARFHRHLKEAVAEDGGRHAVLGAFAEHIAFWFRRGGVGRGVLDVSTWRG